MKKVGVILSVLVISLIIITLTSALVPAPENASTQQSTQEQVPTGDTNTSATTETTQQSVNALQQKTNDFADRTVNLPPRLEKVINIVFKISNTFTISQVIIMVAVFFLFVIFFMDALVAFSPFSETTSRVAGVLLAFILAATGTVQNITLWLINIGSDTKVLAQWRAGALILIVVLLVGCSLIIRRITRYFKKRKEKEQKENQGFSLGVMLGGMKKMWSGFTGMVGKRESEDPFYNESHLSKGISKETLVAIILILLLILLVFVLVYLKS